MYLCVIIIIYSIRGYYDCIRGDELITLKALNQENQRRNTGVALNLKQTNNIWEKPCFEKHDYGNERVLIEDTKPARSNLKQDTQIGTLILDSHNQAKEREAATINATSL